jgi:hypothetical protein
MTGTIKMIMMTIIMMETTTITAGSKCGEVFPARL